MEKPNPRACPLGYECPTGNCRPCLAEHGRNRAAALLNWTLIVCSLAAVVISLLVARR